MTGGPATAGFLDKVSARTLGLGIVVVLLTTAFFVVREPADVKTVTAHFPRAVSVYEGTEVRILGVRVGSVTSVTPEGDSVRVEITYESEQRLPADAKAVVVTPTLVADRFVQLTPAYTEGPVMADGADIPLPDSGVPVELDRIYASLRDLAVALGRNGVNADGTLDHVLAATRKSLGGHGELGNQMLVELSKAAQTFGDGSEDLFATVEELARFTTTLAENDRIVRAFVRDLAGVSGDLADERTELRQALASVADAVGSVQSFVADNREALATDVDRLGRVLRTVSSERESLDTLLTIAPVALGNLAVSFDTESQSVGARFGVGGNVWDLDGFLCSVVAQTGLPEVSRKLACRLFETLLEPLQEQLPYLPPGTAAGARATGPDGPGGAGGAERRTPARVVAQYAGGRPASLADLVGGGS